MKTILVDKAVMNMKTPKMLVLQTSDKKIATMSNQLTTEEIEDMIQKSNVPVPQDFGSQFVLFLFFY